MKVGGLTAIQTYIEWSSHEPQPGQFDFSGKPFHYIQGVHTNRIRIGISYRLFEVL